VRPPLHQPLQEAGPATKAVAMGHEHGDEPERPRVADQGDELAFGPEGQLAVGELHVAPFPEPGADPTELLLDLVQGGGRHSVRGCPEIAAPAGEVAAGHRPDRGSAAGVLTSQELPRRPQSDGHARPSGRQRVPGLPGHGRAKGRAQRAKRHRWRRVQS
jgi:hypothetical protein